MTPKQAMKKAGVTVRDAEIAMNTRDHDHGACAKCLGPRLRILAARDIYQKAKGDVTPL